MQCPKCKRENEPTNRFCIYCGSLLPTPEVEVPTEPEQEQPDISPGQFLALQSEVRRLGELIVLMNERLANLERVRGIPATPPEPIEEELVTPLVAAVPVTEVVPTVEHWEGPLTEPPSPPPAPPPEPRVPTAIEREWEQILGGNWLARIGVLALIIGAGFFLKFAFDQHWLGPTGRVILGVVAGLVMLGGGHYWQKKYPIFAQAISGGGIALIYLCIYAAHVMFDLIGFYPAIVLLLVISIASSILALRYNSMALAILGIIGAFIAPFILATTTVTETGAPSSAQALWLLIYVMVVDIGVLWLSTFRNWRWFTLLALIGSLSVYGVWYGQFGDDFSLLTSMVCLTAIFLIFIGATMLYHIVWRKAAQAFDYILMVINAAAYFGISYGLLWDDLQAWLGGFSLLMALFYGGLAYIARRRGVENIRLALFALGIAMLFLTTAIPAQLGDKAWTTIAWAAQGTILMWLSLRLRMPLLRVFSYLVFAAVIVRLLFFDTFMYIDDFTPVFNERFLAFLVSIAAMYLTGYLVWRSKEILTEGEKKSGYVYPVFLVVANLFSLWIIGAEVINYEVGLHEAWPLVFLVILAGLITLYHVVWRRPSQTFDQVLLVINAAFYVVISVIVWGDLRTWMGSLYFVFSFFFGGLAYVTIRRGTDFIRLGYFAFGIAALLFTAAIPIQLGDKAWTTIAWAAQGTVFMWLSLRLRMPEFRICGYIVFTTVVVRLLFFDTTLDIRTFTPVLNERFLAFLVSIAAMYLVSFILWRKKESLTEQEQNFWSVYPAFLIAANFCTIWLLSAEVWGYFSRQLTELTSSEYIGTVGTGLRSARNLSLTALWAVYAVILLVIGIIRRSRFIRVSGLGLLAIPIFKVFLYDSFALEQLYRIIAFIGLGVLLVVCGYLYQRYREAIKGFITEK